jgi:hypothetical protein
MRQINALPLRFKFHNRVLWGAAVIVIGFCAIVLLGILAELLIEGLL